jgi:hypothetical protein
MPLELVRISGAIPALVMLYHGPSPLTEPRKQWRDQARAVLGMTMEHLPFLLVGLAGFTEEGGRDLELPYIMEQRRPSQSSLTTLVDLQLIGNHVGKDTDALRVSAGCLVVDAESEHQLNNRLHSAGVVLLAGDSRSGKLISELTRVPGPARDREPSRRLVLEEERNVEQGGEGEETPRCALEDYKCKK